VIRGKKIPFFQKKTRPDDWDVWVDLQEMQDFGMLFS
jgi:hypothetical protein